jgi:hypothetical protein
MQASRALIAATVTVLLAACGGSSGPSSAGSTGTGSLDPTTFALQVATIDLVRDEANRVEVGIFRSDERAGVELVTGGTIDLTLRPFQGGDGTETSGSAAYVPAPGTEGDATGEPRLTAPDVGRGVYELDDVRFDASGIWEAEVSLAIDGSPLTLTSQFQVLDDHVLPAPGDRALRTENLTIDTAKDPLMLDSRAQDGAPLPDPELHRDTIAGALRDGRPVLVLFATPVYCQSQFCGPTTDALQAIAAEGPNDVAYIHVEIWADYAASKVNEAAADWLLRDGDLTEPWLFLIDAEGTIVDRWGPLFDPAQVRDAVAAL